MNEERFETEDGGQSTRGFRDVMGYLLLFCGLCLAFWIVLNAYRLFTNPDKLTPFQELVSNNLETIATAGEDKEVKVLIPAEVFAYAVPLFLLAISSGIAGMLISAGVKLLDGDLQRLSRRMTTMSTKIESKVDASVSLLRTELHQMQDNMKKDS